MCKWGKYVLNGDTMPLGTPSYLVSSQCILLGHSSEKGHRHVYNGLYLYLCLLMWGLLPAINPILKPQPFTRKILTNSTRGDSIVSARAWPEFRSSKVFKFSFYDGGAFWALAQRAPRPHHKRRTLEDFDNFSSPSDFVPHLNQHVHHSGLLAETNKE